jgi:phage baseplate assembly protein V
MDLEYRVTELERRLANMLRIGIVDELDPTGAQAAELLGYAVSGGRVKVKIGEEIITGWLPWFTRRAGGDKDWWAPEAGEQVMVLSPTGDLCQGVVLPAINYAQAPAPADVATIRRVEFADGGFLEYDRETGNLTINIPGEVAITASHVDVNCSVGVDGSIGASGSINAEGNIIDGGSNTNHHTHPS